MTFTLLAVAFVVLVVGLLVVSRAATKRHQRMYAAWAAAHGYSYELMSRAYNDLPWGHPFGVGHARKATDVLTGTVNGRPAVCFDYQYTTSSGSGSNQTQSTSHYSMYWIRLPKALGRLGVGRENLGTKIARAVGMHDIELESEAFNRAFTVNADDRKLAYDILNPSLMQWLLDNDAPGFRLIGADLVLIRQGRLRLDDIEPRLAYLVAVADAIPAFVWNDAPP